MLTIRRLETPPTFHGLLQLAYKAGDETIHQILLTKMEEQQLKDYLNGKST